MYHRWDQTRQVGRLEREVLLALAEVPDLRSPRGGSCFPSRVPAGRRRAGGVAAPHRRPCRGRLFDLTVEVAIAGDEVAFQELFVAFGEGRSHLLLPVETYFALDRPELAELAGLIAEARAMQDAEDPASDRIRVSRFQAGLWQAHWEAAVRALTTAGHQDLVGPSRVAEYLGILPRLVRAAVEYYAEFSDEVDEDTAAAERAERSARDRWERQQRALA